MGPIILNSKIFYLLLASHWSCSILNTFIGFKNLFFASFRKICKKTQQNCSRILYFFYFLLFLGVRKWMRIFYEISKAPQNFFFNPLSLGYEFWKLDFVVSNLECPNREINDALYEEYVKLAERLF